jgi:4-hydroxy-tetrahydrodipicolinate reductase
MGTRIIALAAAIPDLRIAGAIEAPGHDAIGSDAGERAGVGTMGIAIASDLEVALAKGNVAIDFSTAAAALAHLRAAAKAGAGIVIGATGFTKEERRELTDLARRAPTVLAPNMSVGVNVLLGLVEDAVKRLGPSFDCEIVELHHGLKRDAPSGTALALAEAVAAGAGIDPERAMVNGRTGMVGERPKGQIGVLAARGGDAVGEHTVMLLGTGERIELVHRATSRDCFAAGALRAALWLRDRPAGLYSMRDVLAASARA